ncbi:MAG: hypothetical protein MR598_03885 [Erysipelotrichaceae bacterium]|nr:hypothetical protein [Erysipelotrichaceae bacterium]
MTELEQLKKEIYLKSRELYQARVEMTSLGNNPEKRQQLETRIIQIRKELTDLMMKKSKLENQESKQRKGR